MPRVSLPRTIDMTFYVLSYDREMGEMTIHLSETESHLIGLVQSRGFDGMDQKHFVYDGQFASTQLQRWGVEKYFADWCIDQAVEFRAVQCIPAQKRVINLIERDHSAVVLRELFDRHLGVSEEATHAYL